MKVNQSLVLSIAIIVACRALNHFIWVEYAKPLLFSYQAELVPEVTLLEDDAGFVGNFRKQINQFAKDNCHTFSYLPWVNCPDSHITKDGITLLWNLEDEYEVALSCLELVALGFLFYNQRRWIALDVFFFQMNGLFYGSFPSFLSTLLSLLQEILKNWVDFPMKDSLAVIRAWEPRVVPLLLVIPIYYQVKTSTKGQNVVNSVISSLNTGLPLLGFVLHALSIQFLETKKVGMVLTAALLIGYYFLIPKIEVKLQPLAKKADSAPAAQSTASNGKSQNPLGSPKPSRNNEPVPNGSSGGTSNGKKK
mmetsp:Transcript_28992/g.40808  ORF Transcript_28992/g.40808 Transcript_28992/m.40808 type:complete len:307 (+) Transcript_28992:78-998(+)